MTTSLICFVFHLRLQRKLQNAHAALERGSRRYRKKFQQPPRPDKLCLVFAPDRSHVDLRAHALEEILMIRDVDDAECFKMHGWPTLDEIIQDLEQLRTFEHLLESPSSKSVNTRCNGTASRRCPLEMAR